MADIDVLKSSFKKIKAKWDEYLGLVSLTETEGYLCEFPFFNKVLFVRLDYDLSEHTRGIATYGVVRNPTNQYQKTYQDAGSFAFDSLANIYPEGIKQKGSNHTMHDVEDIENIHDKMCLAAFNAESKTGQP